MFTTSTAPEPRASCAARLLDVRSYVLAARRSLANAEPGAALFMELGSFAPMPA